MIPDKVVFTGLVIDDPKAVIEGRKLRGPIPSHWSRVRFVFDGMSLTSVDKWITTNIEGRYALHSIGLTEGVVVVVAFERLTDAVMFKMMDGDVGWKEYEAQMI